MNGYERNFDFLEFLVSQQQEARKLIASQKGNNVAIYKFLGISDAIEITDGGVVIAVAHVGYYDSDNYNECVYG